MTNNMTKNLFPILALSVVMTSLAPAAVVTFTGGTITKNGGATIVTNGSILEADVDFYTESGFVLDYIGVGNDGFSSFVGNYYSTGNDVIHGHWGQSQRLTSIDIYKVGGGTFDLNYFVLTTNSDGHPNGEGVSIEGFLNGVSTGTALFLPPEIWGFPAVDVFLNTNFDLVDRVKIVGSDSTFCFGMDEFYIDQAAPVPEPTAGALLALGLGGLIALRRTRRV